VVGGCGRGKGRGIVGTYEVWFESVQVAPGGGVHCGEVGDWAGEAGM